MSARNSVKFSNHASKKGMFCNTNLYLWLKYCWWEIGRNKGKSRRSMGRGVQRQEAVEIKMKRNAHRAERDGEINTEAESESWMATVSETRV